MKAVDFQFLLWDEDHEKISELNWSRRLNFGYLADKRAILQSTLSKTNSDIDSLKEFLGHFPGNLVILAHNVTNQYSGSPEPVPWNKIVGQVQLEQPPVESVDWTPDVAGELGISCDMGAYHCPAVLQLCAKFCDLYDDTPLSEFLHKTIAELHHKLKILESFKQDLWNALGCIRFFLVEIIHVGSGTKFFHDKILIEGPWHLYHGTHPPETSSEHVPFLFFRTAGECFASS